MEKTKILYVHHAGGFGGAPKSMSYIIDNLDQNKYQPYLLNIVKGPIDDFFANLPVTRISPTHKIRPFHGSYVVNQSLFAFLHGWLFLLPSVIFAYQEIKKLNPDLIHLNSSCLFAFAIAAKFCGIKTVCHIREPIRRNWAGWPLRFFNRNFATGFIAISNYDLKSLGLSKTSKTKYQVTYNFVEKLEYIEERGDLPFRQDLKLNDEDILFTYLARFADSNGWQDLLHMSKSLVTKNPKIKVLLVGAKSKEHFVETGHDNIKILGYSKDPDAILKASDVFVCPFKLPHFARGVIEAAAFGVPSLGSDVGGVNELIKHKVTGFLYSTEEEFEGYALRLAEDVNLRKKYGKKAFSFASENFESTKNLKATYDFYNTVMK